MASSSGGDPSRVRLSDVAAVAGVSLSTASKALNGGERISAETVARVQEAAARLDFRPNALARSFALGQSRTIGVLTYRATSTFAGPVLIGVVLELGTRQHASLVYDENLLIPRQMTSSIRELRARLIDGLIVVGDGPERLSPSVTHHFTVPVTYAYAASDQAEDIVYLPDNEQAGRLATRHLVERGRTRIAHITGSIDSLAARRRVLGMQESLREADLSLAAPVSYGSWLQQSGVDAMTDLLDSRTNIDAVFCGNDHIALGVLEVCKARGVRVPDDIAIVGIDNWEGIILDQGVRRLTTIDLRLQTLGRMAAADVIADTRTPGEHRVDPQLVQGPST